MALTPQEVHELNRILDARTGHGRSDRPKLRLIVPPTSNLLDPIFRDAHIKRIIHLRDGYRLRWLVDQATFNVASLSCLEDCDLIRLLNDMERARECIADGVSFEDAGLVRRMDAMADPRRSRQDDDEAERVAVAVESKRYREPEREDASPF